MRSLVACLFAVLAAAPTLAAADCPRITAPDDPVCRPWAALLLPTAFAGVYLPRGEGGTWLGGGLEAALFTWSDNSPSFGPSQGKLRFDLGVYRSTEEGHGTLTSYRGGAQVSFERNAARGALIPYFTTNLGGMVHSGHHGFVDGGAGVYLLHRRSAILDLEATYQVPFSGSEDFAGLRVRLAASFALW